MSDDDKKDMLAALQDMEQRGKELDEKKRVTEARIKKHVPPLKPEKSRAEKIKEKDQLIKAKESTTARSYAALISCVIGILILSYLTLTNNDDKMSFVFGLVLAMGPLFNYLVRSGKL